MKRKNIFVNATSATQGGSLTILNQFIQNIVLDKSIENHYYIFVPTNYNSKLNSKVTIIKIDAKRYKDRLMWDLYKMKKWAKVNNIYPSVIFSLQNTGVKFNNVKQVIYLHQSIPYAKESTWNIFKHDERKLWFYKNIYKLWIDLTIKNKAEIIVQTQWMRDALIKEGYKDEKILVAKPDIAKVNKENIKKIEKEKFLFYPAADYKYKNHMTIVEAVKNLDNKERENIKIVFTLSRNSNIYLKVKEYNLEKHFEFIGIQKYEDILSLYYSCHAVIFPSYIETFGLPLVEAAVFGKKILVSDCKYSKEVLKGYKNVEYINYKDCIKWKDALNESMKSHDFVVNEYKPIENEWKLVFDIINK